LFLRIRLQIQEKRKRAKMETVTADPSVYDRLFAYEHEEAMSEVAL